MYNAPNIISLVVHNFYSIYVLMVGKTIYFLLALGLGLCLVHVLISVYLPMKVVM